MAHSPSPPILFPDVLTLEETATYLRLSPDIVQRQATPGNLPGRSIEGIWRFLKVAIDEWLRGQDPRTTLLQQAGILADDPTLPLLRAEIYQNRGRSEMEPEPQLDSSSIEIPA